MSLVNVIAASRSKCSWNLLNSPVVTILHACPQTSHEVTFLWVLLSISRRWPLEEPDHTGTECSLLRESLGGGGSPDTKPSGFDVPGLAGVVSVLAYVPGYQIFQTGDLKHSVWSFCGPEE